MYYRLGEWDLTQFTDEIFSCFGEHSYNLSQMAKLTRNTGAHPGPVDSEIVRARLKWFNNPKGFGFVVPEDGGSDAFLHVTTLQEAGFLSLGEGAILLCRIERRDKGAQVIEVLDLPDPGVAPVSVAADPGTRSGRVVVMQGAVKWYKPEKGFGFIAADDGQKDIFIHSSCLLRHGMDRLESGMRLSMSVRLVPKGREVVDFQLIDN